MQFVEIGKSDAKTLLLLPGTACTYQINFSRGIDLLAERYHLICVNYDGFEGDSNKPFTDMLTVTEKIENYILEKHRGKVDGAYGSSLGGSFVGLLIQRKRIHIDHGFIGSSDLDQGSKFVAKIMTWIIGGAIAGAGKDPKKKERFKRMLSKGIGMEMNDDTSAFLDAFADSLNKLHPQTIQREFYSDYITPLENDIHVDGTTVHIIYALKMGKKYEKRYLKHFHHPDILRYDMQHEAWLFEQSWTMPVLNDIDACMAK